MTMDRLHAIEVFVRVVETGSFSAAARDLRIGQPAVSKVIAGLEARLGVRLLIRSTRRLSPTDAGQAYYEKARRIVVDADEAETAARGLGRGLEGRLRVCAPVTFARLHITPKLGSFLEAHPKLRLELVMDDRNVDLLEENVDVAIRLGDLADSSLTARKIGEAERLVVASPEYLARHGSPRSPGELVGHAAIVYTPNAGVEQWRFRKGTSDVSVSVPSRLVCTAAEGVREAVLAGLGLAIISRWMMMAELKSGIVTPLLTEWELPSTALWAVFPAGRLPTTKARAFVSWFETRIVA
jgi:DNA-binding transcriptional LysR family regulator